MLERSAGNRLQKIQRDREDAFVVKQHGHFDALLHRFAHAQDAAGTEAKPDFACRAERCELLLRRMRRAQRREERRRGLDIAMVGFDAGIKKTLQILAFQQSHRGTTADRTRLADTTDGRGNLLDIHWRETFPAGN